MKIHDNKYLVEELSDLINHKKIEEGIKDGIKEGIKKGKNQGIKETKTQVAVNMLANNEPIENIVKYTKLSKASVLALKSKL